MAPASSVVTEAVRYILGVRVAVGRRTALGLAESRRTAGRGARHNRSRSRRARHRVTPHNTASMPATARRFKGYL